MSETTAGRPNAGAELAQATQGVSEFVERLARAASAEETVGPVQTVGGRTLVPLATVRVAAGWGIGFGGGGEGAQAGRGGGGGGGGMGSARVLAVAEISQDGVRVRPIPDVTTLGLAGLGLIALWTVTRRLAPDGTAERAARRGFLRFLRRPG